MVEIYLQLREYVDRSFITMDRLVKLLEVNNHYDNVKMSQVMETFVADLIKLILRFSKNPFELL